MGDTELAYIGLGANLGTPRQSLRQAVASLGALPRATVTGVSRLYRTVPVGAVVQPEFWNAVVALRAAGGPDPAAAAMALLRSLKAIERALGRLERARWGPRELDLDLLVFGPHQVHVALPPEAVAAPRPGAPTWLEVPHPAAAERLFVLAPLADLAPELEPPGWGLSVARARDRALAAEGAAAVRVVGAWDPRRRDWDDDRA
jgi:2-amino-4-hydroxy-6-hydroxymethyldihydropteridine diphosphokinase